MKTTYAIILLLFASFNMMGQAVITAVFDGPLSGGTPKGVEIYFTENVDDISRMGISSANNGGGSTGTPEFVLPGGSVSAGDYMYLASEDVNFAAFFGFNPDFTDDALNINGDDAIELFFDGAIIDVFGDVNMDGTGEPWEHLDGWAARLPNTGPDGSTFQLGSWQFSGIDALDGETSNATAANPVPLKSYTNGTVTPDHLITVQSNFFTPSDLIVDPGDIVEWENIGGNHNVNGSLASYPNNTEDFSSGAPASAPWTYQYTFNNPGYNDYKCDPHEGLGMVGSVMVREQGDHYVAVENNFFSPADITINLGESVVWTNISGFHNVNGTTNTYPNNPEGFDNGPSDQNWTWSYTFNTPGVYDYQCDPHAGLGMVGTVTVVSQYQMVDIPTVKQVDPNGIALLDGDLVQLHGIVHGPNYRSSGLEFFLLDDNNNGVMIRTTSSDPAYTVTDGDEITVSGTVDQFSGLIQIVPDIIQVNSSGNALNAPDIVNAPSEATEGSLILIEDVRLVDPSQWPDGSGSVNVQVLKDADTVVIRFDSDLTFNPTPPQFAFDVVGFGTQFDSDAPFDSGYQILPRGDIDLLTSIISIEDVGVKKVYPNPFENILNIESDNSIDRIDLFDIDGKLIRQYQVGSENINLNTSDLSVGTYISIIFTDRGVGTTTVIKK